MASLREFLDFVCACAEQSGQTFSEDFATELERQLQGRFPAERIYIPPAGSRKRASRAAAVLDAGRHLPTGVVAERMGISKSYAHRILKK